MSSLLGRFDQYNRVILATLRVRLDLSSVELRLDLQMVSRAGVVIIRDRVLNCHGAVEATSGRCTMSVRNFLVLVRLLMGLSLSVRRNLIVQLSNGHL